MTIVLNSAVLGRERRGKEVFLGPMEFHNPEGDETRTALAELLNDPSVSRTAPNLTCEGSRDQKLS